MFRNAGINRRDIPKRRKMIPAFQNTENTEKTAGAQNVYLPFLAVIVKQQTAVCACDIRGGEVLTRIFVGDDCFIYVLHRIE